MTVHTSTYNTYNTCLFAVLYHFAVLTPLCHLASVPPSNKTTSGPIAPELPLQHPTLQLVNLTFSFALQCLILFPEFSSWLPSLPSLPPLPTPLLPPLLPPLHYHCLLIHVTRSASRRHPLAIPLTGAPPTGANPQKWRSPRLQKWRSPRLARETSPRRKFDNHKKSAREERKGPGRCCSDSPFSA